MATIPFATVADYESRFGEVEDESRLEVFLNDASVMMAVEMGAAGVDYANAQEPLASAIVAVCCEVAHRSMGARPDLYGVTNYSQGATDYSESFTYANPNGDMYLTKTQKRMLGIRGGSIGSVRPAIHDGAGDPVDSW